MKYLTKTVCAIVVIASFYGFKSADKEKDNKESAEWSGVYKEVQKTDEKEKISVLYLNADLTYVLEAKENGSTVSVSDGSLSWNKAGDEVTLASSEERKKIVYALKENVLEKISEKGKSVAETPNQLHKIDLQEIAGKYWKLIEIEGDSVGGTYDKEPHLFLKKSESLAEGSGGCNEFSGRCDLAEGNRIKIYKILSSITACSDMEIEKKLFKTLQLIDSYTISENGQYLSLQRSKKEVSARFEVDYFK
ncbi:MAG: META domain-containing protein [Lentimicrobiaceae bacterium]|nr:META domain-containing protein [Lentimicrobiaceae bacterium]